MTNPYDAPATFDNTATASPPVAASASLIWFGVGVIATSYILYLYTYNFFFFARMTETMIKSVIPVTFFSIAALAVYRIVRFFWPRRLQFSSSPFSLANAGAIVGVYCGGLEYCSQYVVSQPNQPTVYFIGILIGFPICFAVMHLERLIAGTLPNSVVAIHSSSASRASVFYFSGVAFVSAFVFSCGFVGWQEFFGVILMTAMLGILLTVCYGAISLAFRRSHEPTTMSRVVAAIASSLFCFSILIVTWIVHESDPRNLLAVPAGAIFGVIVERLLLARNLV